MKRTKKKLALAFLLLCLLLPIIGATGAIAAPQSELTAEEKFQALMDAGFFDDFGIDDVTSLDENMTRAQAATIIAKMLGLEQRPDAAAYLDLDDAGWAAGFIGAVTEAGIMQGYGNGIFDPNADVTLEQLAVIITNTLQLEVPSEAQVDGASDWAEGYVQAAIGAGVLPSSTDYSLPARTETLVESSYATRACLNEPALAVTDAKLDLGGDDGVLTLGFTTAISADSVQSDTIVVNGAKLRLDKDQVAVSEDGKTLTVTLKEAVDRANGEGEPAIEVDGIQTACSKPMPEGSRSVALEVVNEPPAKPKPPVEPEPSSEPESSNPPSSDPSPWIEVFPTVTSSTYSPFFSTLEMMVEFENVESIAYLVLQPEGDTGPTPEQIQYGDHSDSKDWACLNVSLPPHKIIIGAANEGWNEQPFHVYVVGIKGSQYTSVLHLSVP